MSTTKTYKEKLQLLLNTKTQFKNDIINAGGTIDNSTPFSSYPAIYKTLKGGAPDGTAVEVTTEADMDALLTAANVGKFYKYTGETTDKYTKDAYYIIQDSDNPIVQECSGGSGVVKIERKGTGVQAVPNSGLVEKLVFNIDLTPTEVDNIIANANLNWVQPSSTEPPMYFVFFSMEAEAALIIMNYGVLIGEGVDAYMLMAMIPGESDPAPIYASSILKELLGGLEGWNMPLFEALGSNVFPLNTTAESEMTGVPIGAQNESIKELINIGGVEPYLKELNGTYEPVDVNITENTTIDLVTQYMDNKQMPINLNVQTTKGTIDITNNGEHDVSKYEKANVNVTVLPALQEKTVNAYTSTQVVTPDSGYNGLSKVTINPVTSSIDSDIKAANIKKDVNILGIKGTYTGAAMYPNNGISSSKVEPITEIPDGMFFGFNGIGILGSSRITSYGKYAFSYCSNLETVYIYPATYGIGCFSSCDFLKKVYINTTTLEEYINQVNFASSEANPCCNFGSYKYNEQPIIYLNYTPLSILNIPEGVTEIKNSTFFGWNCVVDEIKLPSTLKKLQVCAFGGHSNKNKLKKVYINSLEQLLNIEVVSEYSVTQSSNPFPFQFNPTLYINNIVFDGNLVVPNNITTIQPCIFNNFPNLKSLTLHENITYIGDYSFRNTLISGHLIIPESVSYLGQGAFQHCGLNQVTIPTTITKLNTAFGYCPNLTLLNFDNIEEIESIALSNTGFTNLELKKLNIVSGACFYECLNLEKVDLHIATRIDLMAFTNCGNLKTVIIRTTSQVCTLSHTNAFKGTLMKNGNGILYVPDSLVASYKADANWQSALADYNTQIKPLSEYVE